MDNRPISGKGERLEIAKRKYEMFQNRQDKLQEMDNILTGKQKETIVPKPGEFVIVSTDKKFDPSAELSLGLDDLLDSARQTIKSRLESARKTSKHKVIGGTGRGMSQTNMSSYQQQNSQQNLNTMQNDDNLLSSISSQPQRRFQIGQQMATVKEKVFQQHQQQQQLSQQNMGAGALSTSDHGLPGSQTQRGNRPLQFMKLIFYLFQNRQMSGSMNSLQNQSLYSARNSQYTQQNTLHRLIPQNQIPESIEEQQQLEMLDKQKSLITNPDMKTSMTTSIRNIMRKQDKDMLTQSSRLLVIILLISNVSQSKINYYHYFQDWKSIFLHKQAKIQNYSKIIQELNAQNINHHYHHPLHQNRSFDSHHHHPAVHKYSHQQMNMMMMRINLADVLFFYLDYQPSFNLYPYHSFCLQHRHHRHRLAHHHAIALCSFYSRDFPFYSISSEFTSNH